VIGKNKNGHRKESSTNVNRRRTRERGERLFVTESCVITGYLVQEFCETAISRCESRRVRGIVDFFRAFLSPTLRGAVEVEEMIRWLKLDSYVDPDVRLREITTNAREIAWDMATVPARGEAMPPNQQLLMPAIVSEPSPGHSSDVSVQQRLVVLQRVTSYLGRPINDYFKDLYADEFHRLVKKRESCGLTPRDLAKYGALSMFLDIISGRQQFFQVGDVIAGYRLERQLRTNEYRTIFLAKALGSNHAVVLKGLTPKGATLTRERAAFEESANVHAKLRHPNIPKLIVPLADHFGVPYYAVTFIDGRPLSELTECTREHAMRLLLNIADVLSRLHESKISHGDLAPDNIVVDDSGDPHFIDFESAWQEGNSEMSRMFVRATDRYLSPERRLDPHRRQPADDVYSFGVLASEILSQGRQAPELVINVLRESPETEALANVLVRCLSTESGGRFSSAVELNESLRTAVKGGGGFTSARPIIRGISAKRSFVRQTIEGRDFTAEDLRASDFSHATLRNCTFSNSVLTSATFQYATFENVSFDGAFVILARFQSAVLRGCTFKGANLERTVWDGAEIQGPTDFRWVNFWGAFLSGLLGMEHCDISAANFFRTEISPEQSALLTKATLPVTEAGNYGVLADLWKEMGRSDLIWWLDEACREGGLAALY
jgi:serine/threonine protein kinase